MTDVHSNLVKFYSFYYFFKLFIYLLLAVLGLRRCECLSVCVCMLGLCCCLAFSLVEASRRCSLVAVPGVLTAMASVVVVHGF